MAITIEGMINMGLELNDVVELTLCNGAEYDNGYTSAPTMDPRGFHREDQTVDEDGPRIIGYVQKLEPKKRRLYLRQTAGVFVEPNGARTEFPVDSYYVDENLIRSYRFFTAITPEIRFS